MALVVGELIGYIRMDDGQVRPALDRTERTLKASGARMANIAENSGQEAGQRAGDALGTAIGEGLRDTAVAGADDAVDQVGGRFGRLKMLAAGAGLAAGAALVVGLQETLSQAQITARLRAQLGATPAEAKRYGEVAGQLFAKGITADFQTAADAIRATMSNNLVPADATNADLESISTKVADLANTFELDLGQTATAVGQMMRSNMAPDATSALDLIAAGMTGADSRADDLLETMTEYGPIFQQAGISGATAMGLIKQGIAANVKDTDKIADAVKEFTLQATEGSKDVQEAFKVLGMDGEKAGADVAAGGARAEGALADVLDKLRELPATTARADTIKTLFGGPGEDLGAALFKLDVDKAAGAMSNAAGESGRLGTALRDGPAYQVGQLQTRLRQGLVNVLGGEVIPVLARFVHWARENSDVLRVLAGVIGGVLVPALVLMGAAALSAGVKTAYAWTQSGLAALRALPGQVAAAARVVAGWVLMGTQALLQAARMAAAWVIALGPVGWVIAAIVAVAAIIFLNWDKIKKYTAMAWDWIWGKIKAIGSWIVTTMVSWVARALAQWERFKSSAIDKARSLVDWVRGLPRRIGQAVGNLGSLLYGKGRDVVMGLWNGIKGMGSWLAGQLSAFARNLVPGPIARALGIASPSKVMRDQIGRYIPAGIVEGIKDGAPALDRTMAGLVTPHSVPGMSGPGGGPMSGQGPGTQAKSGASRVVVRFDFTGADSAFKTAIQKIVRVDGRGDVQVAFGQ
ncbi:phage tail tape measure protein [Streptomyces sp. NPDC090026]|uniref:phage tail tape measure protein n=1 Tax=Streptomyces sp. NPDC090026 TaxID=3365923 RepID=UPI00380538E4